MRRRPTRRPKARRYCASRGPATSAGSSSATAPSTRRSRIRRASKRSSPRSRPMSCASSILHASAAGSPRRRRNRRLGVPRPQVRACREAAPAAGGASSSRTRNRKAARRRMHRFRAAGGLSAHHAMDATRPRRGATDLRGCGLSARRRTPASQLRAGSRRTDVGHETVSEGGIECPKPSRHRSTSRSTHRLVTRSSTARHARAGPAHAGGRRARDASSVTLAKHPYPGLPALAATPDHPSFPPLRASHDVPRCAQ